MCTWHLQRTFKGLCWFKIAKTFKDLAYIVEQITKFEVHSVNLGNPQTCSIVRHFFRDFLSSFPNDQNKINLIFGVEQIWKCGIL